MAPPGVGYYKLLMYGIPRPQVKGRWRLPLLACYLVECKMAIDKNKSEDDDGPKKEPKKKVRLRGRR